MLVDKDEYRLIRPDRFDVTQEPFFFQVNQEEFKVLDYSSFGLGVKADSHALLQSELEGELVVKGKNLGSFAFKSVRRKTDVQGQFDIVGMETLFAALPVEKIDAILTSQKVFSQMQRTQVEFDQIPAAIKKSIYSLFESLKILEVELHRIEKARQFYQFEEQFEFESHLCTFLTEQLTAIFQFAGQVDEGPLVKDFNAKTFDQIAIFFKLTLLPLFQQSPVLSSNETPLNLISQQATMTPLEQSELLGKTLFGKVLSQFFFSHPLSLAIKDRSYYLFYQFLDYINAQQDKPIRIVALESGAVMELQMLLKHFVSTPLVLEIFLLDSQMSILKKTQKKLRDISLSAQVKPNLKFHQLTSPDSLKRFFSSYPNSFDLVYSTGLMDVLEDEQFLVTLNAAVSSLKPEGKAIFGTFDVHNHQQLLLQLAFNPSLKYRSSDQMLQLFEGLPSVSVNIEQEPGSVNCFTSLTRKDVVFS